MRVRRRVAVAAILAAVAYVGMSFWGVFFLVEGDTDTGILLLALTAIGVPSFLWWFRSERRRFISRNARPS